MNNDSNKALHAEPDNSEACCVGVNPPFLSIITRTQGRRLHTLVEMLTCLAAQSDTDFEVLLLGHCLDTDSSNLVLGLVDDCPLWLRNRIRYLAVDDGTRTRPLKIGLKAARGAYVAMLDDDDIIFSHWVETFRNLSRAMPGRVLRSNTLVQVVDTVSVHGVLGLRAEAAPETKYAKTFNFFDHILENQSPLMTLAFPRRSIEHAGIDFDETLSTTEDWDFLMRCASVLGVADVSEITSIYRWWNKGESSRTQHLSAEWRENHHRIWKNWDSAGFALPPGSPRELVNILQEHAAFKAELQYQHQNGVKLKLDPALFNGDTGQRPAGAKLRAMKILNSTSWRITRPLRKIAHPFSREREIDAVFLRRITVEQAEALVVSLYQSWSWRLAAPIRLLKPLADRVR